MIEGEANEDKGESAKVHEGDMRRVLRELAVESVDSCVCDPPYELNFMNQAWDRSGIAFQPETWSEVLRVLKPGGYLIAMGGPRTFHRLACAIEDAGFELRDTLAWLYSSGFPKSHDVSQGIDKVAGAEGYRGAPRLLPNGREHHFNIGFSEGKGYDAQKADRYTYVPATAAAREWQGWGTALKPAIEPIILARKPLSEKTVAANVLRWRTGAININGCRVGTDSVSTHFRGVNGAFSKRPTEKAPEDSGRKADQRNGIDYSPRTGRWPANLIHDGSDEVVAMFLETKGQLAAVGPNNGPKCSVNVYGDYGPREQFEPRNDSGSAARFFYCAKASASERNGSKHPTVKPLALMRWLVRLVTPPGGLVLDPFAGSGSTGEAALLEGFRAVLIEHEHEYAIDIERRLERAKRMQGVSLDELMVWE